jgi:hypothetical protein
MQTKKGIYTAAIWGGIAGLIFALLHSLPERISLPVAGVILALLFIGAAVRWIRKETRPGSE